MLFGLLFLLLQANPLERLSRISPNQQILTIASSTLNAIKVPGESPAYYCSNPKKDIFQIRRFDFIPTNVRIGFYQTTRFIGTFISPTGVNPWLNITGSINGRQELSPFYSTPLCDIDVFQKISIPTPTLGVDPSYWSEEEPRLHRACPPEIGVGYVVVSSPPMPLRPQTVPEGKYDLRAEAMTQDGRSIFCVQGTFDVTI